MTHAPGRAAPAGAAPSAGVPGGPAAGDGRRTRWEAHRRARRAELVEAALRLIAREGPAVGMDDIAAEAGTSKTVLYRHFADKEQLHQAVAERVDRRVVAALRTAVEQAGPPRAAMQAAITAYLRLLREDPHVYRFVVAAPGVHGGGVDGGGPAGALTSAIGAELGRLIAERLDPGPGAPAPDALARAAPWGHGVVALVRAAADAWLGAPAAAGASPGLGPLSADSLGSQLTVLVWDGLGALLPPAGDVPADPGDPGDPDHLLHPTAPLIQETS